MNGLGNTFVLVPLACYCIAVADLRSGCLRVPLCHAFASVMTCIPCRSAYASCVLVILGDWGDTVVWW